MSGVWTSQTQPTQDMGGYGGPARIPRQGSGAGSSVQASKLEEQDQGALALVGDLASMSKVERDGERYPEL